MFMDGDEEGTVFYVDSTGLYRYAFGGNVIEQVIDGSMNAQLALRIRLLKIWY